MSELLTKTSLESAPETKNSEKKRPKKLLRKLGAVIIAGVSLISVVGGKVAIGDALAVPRAVASSIDTCDSVSPEAVDRVADAISWAQDTSRPKSPLELLEQESKNNPALYFDKIDDLMHQSAENNSLHLLDVSNYKEELSNTETSEQALAVAKEYFNRIGVSLRVIDNTSSRADVDSSQIDFATLQYNLENLIDSFSILPYELIEYSGVKNLEIVMEAINMPYMKDAGGLAYIPGNTIFIRNVDSFQAQYTPEHELGHLIDGASCGAVDMNIDKRLRNLNLPSTEYIGYKKYNSIRGDAGDGIYYSDVNPAENKAAILAEIMNGIYTPMLTKQGSEREKTILTLERLEEVIPGITRYFLETGYSRYSEDSREDALMRVNDQHSGIFAQTNTNDPASTSVEYFDTK